MNRIKKPLIISSLLTILTVIGFSLHAQDVPLDNIETGQRFIETKTYTLEEDREILKAYEGLRVVDVSDGLDIVGLMGNMLLDPEIKPLWKNTDDLEGLPQLALQQRSEQVYHAPINPYEGRWHSVAPLAELLREAIASAGNDSRILSAELHIRGVPMTEIDYRLNEQAKPQRLYLVGFDNQVVGTWALLNPERIVLIVVSLVLVLVIVGVVVLSL